MRTFNIKLLYLYKFMSQCLPIYTFYTILFIERGMSVTDIAVLLALWSIFTIVFEVPSGILADRWNRRNMLAIAAILQGICFVIWYYSHTLLMFTVGFVFWAIAAAFISGTEEGLTYDNLKSDGNEKDFAKVYGKARFYANMGVVVGILSAGLIASYIPIETIALISAAICFVNALLALQLREKNYYSEQLDEKTTGFFKTLKEALAFTKGSKTAFISIVFLVFFASLGNYLDEYDALIINDFKLSNIWVSTILTVRYVFVALGDVIAPIIQKQINTIRQIFALGGFAGIILIIFTILWHQYVILIYGLALMVMSVTEILLINLLQDAINEEGRATVMSFYGIGQNIIMIAFSLVYALLADILTLQQVYIIIAIYSAIGSFSICLFFKTVKNRF